MKKISNRSSRKLEHTMLRDERVTDFIALTDSDAQAPGGGSVAALVAALGAALDNMVIHLSHGKKAYENLDDTVRAEIEAAVRANTAASARLAKMIDRDAESFGAVLAAYKLPKTTDEEKNIREAAIRRGYEEAMRVPFAIAEEARDALVRSGIFARYGTKTALTDVAVGTIFLEAAIDAALWNVIANLHGVDKETRTRAEEKIMEIRSEAHAVKEETLALVRERLEV